MSEILQNDVIPVSKEQDIIFIRNRTKEVAAKLGIGLLNQTKLITAASELFRNMLRHANGGKVTIQIISDLSKKGVQLIFEDSGPGIPDIDKAMEQGYSTVNSLGLGLSGARNLSDHFEINSEFGKGTTVKIIKWADGRG